MIMYALVDCNNFYASCERLFRPDLTGKPIVVLSNNDGCVIARSAESKALGVPMGAPAFEYEKMFRDNGVSVFSANFALYGDLSQRVMSVLSEFSPEMEIYSIDEAFLRLHGFEQYDLQAYGTTIRNKVIKWTGIPVCIGAAPTKTLAKAANRIAKQFPQQTGGVHIIDTEEKRIKALKWLKIEDVWGIGRQHTKRLKAHGVHTAYAFTQLSGEWVRRNMAVVGLRTQAELQGQPSIEMETVKGKKSIATTRSFDANYTEFDQLQERVSTFAASCAEKLRHQHSRCSSLTVFLNTNFHRQDLPQYSQSLTVRLPYSTNSTIELSRFATYALKQIFRPGYSYKKAGVIIQDFSAETAVQLSLYENSDIRHIPLMHAIDQLNERFGQHKVRLGSQDIKRVWRMKQERLSPCYSTKLSDIITINA